jgi:hypothetical protein
VSSGIPWFHVVGLIETLFSNAFIFPVVYFFYPETARRSLEEMDSIFRKTTSVFDVVKVARDEPRRYGEHGELLIDYAHTDEHFRRASHVAGEKDTVHNKDHANPDYHLEHGTASQSS